ncbi:MAG: DUF3990 domain-containing protein [Lachnospiraceae bacterium]
MKEILFHGSEFVIETPVYGKGAKTNDYGRGFYCTQNIELAKEWACAKNKDGYVNQYEIDISGLSILNLNDSQYSVLNWLAVLADNRTYWQNSSIAEEAKRYLKENFLVDIKEYDVIRGYRADDSYFSFAQDFVMGAISLQKLSEAMRLGKLGEQVVLKSQRAFGRIEYKGSESVSATEYYLKKAVRDREARREYRRSKKTQADIQEIFILDIMREGMRNGDPRLR